MSVSRLGTSVSEMLETGHLHTAPRPTSSTPRDPHVAIMITIASAFAAPVRTIGKQRRAPRDANARFLRKMQKLAKGWGTASVGSHAPVSARPATSGARFGTYSVPKKQQQQPAPAPAPLPLPPVSSSSDEASIFEGIEVEPCFAELDDICAPSSAGFLDCYTYVPNAVVTRPRRLRTLEVSLSSAPEVFSCVYGCEGEDSNSMTNADEPQEQTATATEVVPTAGAKRGAFTAGLEDGAAATAKRTCSAETIESTESSQSEELAAENGTEVEEAPGTLPTPSDTEYDAEQIAEKDAADVASLMALIDATAEKTPSGSTKNRAAARATAEAWEPVREMATRIVENVYSFPLFPEKTTGAHHDEYVASLSIANFIKSAVKTFTIAQRTRHALPYEQRVPAARFGRAKCVQDLFSAINAAGLKGGIIIDEANLLDHCTSEDPLHRIGTLARVVRLLAATPKQQ